ncbi:MAG: YHYH protein [Bacteroidota bacterium]
MKNQAMNSLTKKVNDWNTLSWWILMFFLALTFAACNQTDDDCIEITYYEDADSDGLGNPDITMTACTQPDGFVSNANDADDTTFSTAICDGSQSTFTINLTMDGCIGASAYTHSFSMTENIANDQRTIEANNIPEHSVGQFPNPGNPNTITPQSRTYTLDLTPSLATNPTGGNGYVFGILFSGVEMDPYTAEFFVTNNGVNRDWNYNALTSAINLGTDCNNAHVQPTGKYHYHGTPVAFLQELGVDGSEMVKVGYAADGFPIYYKYGYDESGTTLIAMESGYQIKTEDRGGDGISAPGGCPDGTFFQDYEYVEGISLLDGCNGRWGKTPESDNEYYYVITDNFPSSPMCFSGTPSTEFRL